MSLVDRDAIDNLGQLLALGGRVSFVAQRWEEGWTVNVYHRGRSVDMSANGPRERVEDAMRDALIELGLENHT